MTLITFVSPVILKRAPGDFRVHYIAKAGRRVDFQRESFSDLYAALYRWRVLSFEAGSDLSSEPTIKTGSNYGY